jgi:hypothetical protein
MGISNERLKELAGEMAQAMGMMAKPTGALPSSSEAE